jgi:glycosyltransferase involved in cell wall biosynthesis
MQLAIITTHPIQYYAPVFKLLHERQQINIKVFYTCGANMPHLHDEGFGVKITWDIPLLEGYPYEWVNNTAANPGSHHFKGIINPGLIDQVNAFKPDALLVIGWSYSGHLKAMRYYKNKIPVFFRGDSTLLDEKPGIKNILRYALLKWVYKHVDHAFYTGTNNKAYFKKYGLQDNQLSFAPHAVDNDRFAIDRAAEVQLFKQQLGIPETDIIILFAGKFQEKKDPELLLNAFITLKKAQVHLLFAGDGHLANTLKLKAQGHKNIHFIDFQNQTYMPVIYQACDLFCLPSKGPGETWGLAVNEAMAGKKAVLVANKCGCAVDLVKKEINGDIFKSANSDDLVNCLNYLTESKTLLQSYGEQSFLMIQDWNFLNTVKAIEDKLR